MARTTKPATDTLPKAEDSTPAAFVLPAITILTNYVPPVKSTPKRVAAPNPFDAVVAQLLESWDDEQKRSLNGFSMTINKTDVTRTKAKLNKAANDKDRSPAYVTTGETATAVTLHCYLVPRITRNKAKASEETAPAKEATASE
jgi:hypothetical protein